jgi:GMP synthase (glutamine-hydrolysing)
MGHLLRISPGSRVLPFSAGRATLHPGTADEVGIGTVNVVTDDRIFGSAGDTVSVFHWHHDVVEAPAGATVLASTDQTPNQAFRIGDQTFSTQFHVEVDRHMLDRWLAVDQMADELEHDTRLTIQADFDAAAGSMRDVANRAFTDFTDAVMFRD